MDRRPSRVTAYSVWVLTALFFAAFDTTVRSQSPTAFEQAWQSGTPVTVTGVLTVMYADDFAHNRAELVHMIRESPSGKSFRLRFEKDAPRTLRAGQTVTISGHLRGSEIYILADMTDASSSATPTTQPSSQTAPVTGDQPTLVIVANFTDTNVSCSPSDIGNLMFNDPAGQTVNGLYQEMSRGTLSFSGTVVGPYTLPYASTDPCDVFTWADTANTAASGSVDVNAYSRKVYVMPNSSCPAAGYAELGLTPSRAWIFECGYPDVFSHEIGHNIGLYHASSPGYEYGDGSDYMGLGRGVFRELGAPHRYQMRWLPDSNTQTISQDGSYTVAPLEVDPTTATAPQALKAFKSDTNEYYYVSYRRGIGFDTYLCCAYLDRLSVHRWSGSGNTYLLAMLADGETFTDSATGFSVTQISHSDMFSTALVHLGSGCGSAAPSLTMSPVAQSGSPGSGAVYDVALVNNDAAACATTTFALAGSIPSGWTGSLSAGSLQIAPGLAGHATLTVTSPITASSGVYSDIVNVSDPNVAVHAASTAGSFTVTPSCPRGATAITFSPSSQTAPAGANVKYSLTLTNNDGSSCGATTFSFAPSVPSGWTASLSSAAVSLAPGTSGTVTYSVTSAVGATPSSYGIGANVSDGVNAAHNASATATYVVPSVDATPPTAPTSLIATFKRGQVTLSWQPSMDNVAVVGYRVLRNGSVIATTPGTNWVDQPPTTTSTLTYAVVAYDAAGNVSASSNSAVITTNSGGKKR